MALLLRAPTALVKDSGLVPRVHVWQFITAYNFSSRGIWYLILPKFLCILSPHIHIAIHLKNKFQKFTLFLKFLYIYTRKYYICSISPQSSTINHLACTPFNFMLFCFIAHWFQKLSSICAQMLEYPLKHGHPTSGHMLKKNTSLSHRSYYSLPIPPILYLEILPSVILNAQINK